MRRSHQPLGRQRPLPGLTATATFRPCARHEVGLQGRCYECGMFRRAGPPWLIERQAGTPREKEADDALEAATRRAWESAEKNGGRP